MKKKSNVSLGPGASSLILIFVVLSLAVLGMLALMTARNDDRLSRRSAEVVQDVYLLSEQAEEHFAEVSELSLELLAKGESADAFWQTLDFQLPDWAELDGEAVVWKETDGTRTLDCAMTVLPERKWLRHILTSSIADAIEGFEEDFEDAGETEYTQEETEEVE